MNVVYEELIAKGARVLKHRTLVGENPKDFECIVHYEGKSVGMYSMGDYLMRCCFAAVRYAHCDKLILAYNNGFKQDLAGVVASCQNHTVIKKTHGNPVLSNKKDADAVLSRI